MLDYVRHLEELAAEIKGCQAQTRRLVRMQRAAVAAMRELRGMGGTSEYTRKDTTETESAATTAKRKKWSAIKWSNRQKKAWRELSPKKKAAHLRQMVKMRAARIRNARAVRRVKQLK